MENKELAIIIITAMECYCKPRNAGKTIRDQFPTENIQACNRCVELQKLGVDGE